MTGVLAVSVWSHRRCRRVGSAAIEAHTVARNTNGLHVLHDRVLPSDSIAVRALLQPRPAGLVHRLCFGPPVDIRAVPVAQEKEKDCTVMKINQPPNFWSTPFGAEN